MINNTLKEVYTIDFSDKHEDLFDLGVPRRVYKVAQRLKFPERRNPPLNSPIFFEPSDCRQYYLKFFCGGNLVEILFLDF